MARRITAGSCWIPTATAAGLPAFLHHDRSARRAPPGARGARPRAALTEHVHLAFPAREPGERAVYHPGYYGAFVLDPDGHNVEVVNHNLD
jgi:hypothetical protein